MIHTHIHRHLYIGELLLVEQDSVVWGILVKFSHTFKQVGSTSLPQPWYAATSVPRSWQVAFRPTW